MPSEIKTENLGLNKWEGNEYPKRTDFVNDNEIIDETIGKLESLKTENKSNLVAAVNEVREQNENFAEERGYIITKSYNSIDRKTINENGKYKMTLCVNMPIDNAEFALDVTKHSDNYIVHVATCMYSPGGINRRVMYKSVCLNGVWGEWEKIVTDKQPDWITATLQNGWTAFGNGLQYTKNDLGMVAIKFTCTAGTVANRTVIANLPAGYRPYTNTAVIFDLMINTNDYASGEKVAIQANGNIYVANDTALTEGQIYLGQVSYYAGN